VDEQYWAAMNRSRSESTLKIAQGNRRPFRASYGSAPTVIVPEEPNPLLDSVRERLETLRQTLYSIDLEQKHVRDQKLLEEALFEEEVQKIISKKIREAVILEDSSGSIRSRVSTRSGLRSITSASIQTCGPGYKLLGPARLPPPVDFAKFRAVQTFPHRATTSHHDRSIIKQTSPAPSDDGLEMSYDDEVSEINSLGSVSQGSLSRRPALIVIKKSDVDLGIVRKRVKEKLPSPDKPMGEARYPTPSCTASLIAREQRLKAAAALAAEQAEKRDVNVAADSSKYVQRLVPVRESSGDVSNHNSEKSVGGGSGRQGSGRWSIVKPIVQRNGLQVLQREDSFGGSEKAGRSGKESGASYPPSRPAPFLKARSSSGILNTIPADVIEAVAAPPKDVVGPMVKGLSVAQIRKAVKRDSNLRSSQQFSGNGANAVSQALRELQGTDILDSRFGGWTPPPPTASSKHNTTNFY
jgi:hypothetical protein